MLLITHLVIRTLGLEKARAGMSISMDIWVEILKTSLAAELDLVGGDRSLVLDLWDRDRMGSEHWALDSLISILFLPCFLHYGVKPFR